MSAALSLHDALTLGACVGHLSLGALVLVRGGRSPLALPLIALCVDFFLFNGADIAGHFSSARGWIYVDVTAASMLTPIALHLSLAFVGLRRAHARGLTAAYLAFGAISALCALAFVWPFARRFAGSPAWACVLLSAAVPTMVPAFWVLGRALRRAPSALERARTQLFLLAFAIGTAGCVTDLLADARLPVPRLGNVGTLAGTILFATVVLRLKLFERSVSAVLVVNALVVGVLQVGAYLAVFRYLGGHHAPLILGTAAVTLAVVPVARELARRQSESRQRLEHLATLGRFAAQMAHDIRNPLAVIKGAAQYLDVEAQKTRGDGKREPRLAMILEQVARVDGVIAQYQRIGRVEPERRTLDLAHLARDIAEQQAVAAREGVRVRAEPGEDGLFCDLDPDLVGAALENLIRNSSEALPESGGEITVSVKRERDSKRDVAVVSVRDNGRGMDPRVRERAFEDFFTTRAQGTGLGLALVRRVAEAHGGDAAIESAEGRGTEVRMRFPLRERASLEG